MRPFRLAAVVPLSFAVVFCSIGSIQDSPARDECCPNLPVVATERSVSNLLMDPSFALTATVPYGGREEFEFNPTQCARNLAVLKETLAMLQRGTSLRDATINFYGEIESGGYLLLAAHINANGTVGAAIDLRKNGLPTEGSWQLMAWPKRFGMTGAVTYALIGTGGRIETFTNASSGYSGEGIVHRSCHCFLDASRALAQQSTIAGRSSAHGYERWVPVN